MKKKLSTVSANREKYDNGTIYEKYRRMMNRGLAVRPDGLRLAHNPRMVSEHLTVCEENRRKTDGDTPSLQS